jgi:hypothetical protein
MSTHADLPSAAGAEEVRPMRLSIVLLISNSDGTSRYESIESLPRDVRSDLVARFDTLRTIPKTRVRYYETLEKNPSRYIQRQSCVTHQVIMFLRQNRRGKQLPAQEYSHGGSFRHSADDRCVKDLVPCAHLANNVEGREYCIYFVPLPQNLREGKDWRELKFWVLN